MERVQSARMILFHGVASILFLWWWWDTFIFGSDQYLTITLFLISQGPLEPVLNTISTDIISPGGCFLHDKDHIYSTSTLYTVYTTLHYMMTLLALSDLLMLT